MTAEKWAALLMGIMEGVVRLEAGLVSMKQECLRLEADGMWPAVPSESWEMRNRSTHGEARYLRLVFGRDKPAGYPRKVYVGCDRDKIAEARKKTVNRRWWEELDKEITCLERFLQMMRGDLQRVASSVERRRLPEGTPLLIVRDLVTPAAGAGAAPVTKEEWVLTGAPQVEYNPDVKAVVIEEDPGPPPDSGPWPAEMDRGRFPYYWEKGGSDE